MLRYDNEAGKGGHVHSGARALGYRFVDVDTLPSDFRTISLKVGGLKEALGSFQSAWDTGAKTAPEISFASWELMRRILTPKRLEIIRALCGQPPPRIREVPRRASRDFKGVHTDVTALVASGLVEQRQGKICSPCDRIHVEFDIDAAA